MQPHAPPQVGQPTMGAGSGPGGLGRVKGGGGGHRAVSAEAAEAGTQDGAPHQRCHAACHVHHPGPRVVDGPRAEQQPAVGPAPAACTALGHLLPRQG